jgi:hypothetical protein
MGLFDFFKSKSETDLPEIPEDVFIEKGDEIARGGHSSRIEASLDGVYEFLKADFETRGYNDSLINSDSSYRDENVEVLMWDLIILCKHAISKYDDKIVNLDNHISSRKRLGALDVIHELESEKKRIIEKIKEIEIIMGHAESKREAPSRVIKSYARGFHRGMIALSKSTINAQK